MVLKVGLILVSIISVGVASKAANKYVSLRMLSKWQDTEMLAEASEFMAEQGSRLYWKFIDHVAVASENGRFTTFSDKNVYEYIMKTAGELLSPARLDIMKFSMALRVDSPVVEMFRQIANDAIEGKRECQYVIDVHGRQSCSIQELDSLLEQAEDREQPQTYSEDHHHPGSQTAKIHVILYARIYLPQFAEAHSVLKARAAKRELHYVLRHHTFAPGDADRKVVLAGYGVELAIKSTEYKAQDDSKVTANFTGEAVVEEEETDLDGFNFRLLKQKHPELRESLDEFKLHLLEADELTPLKVWQLQDLSFQAGQRVVSASRTDAITVLQDISQNFPVMARSLTRTVVKEAFRKEVEKNQADTFEELGIQPGDAALYINGLSVDVDTLDIFSLLDILKKEEKLSAGFFRMGYRREYLSMLTDVDLSKDSTVYAVDFRPAFPDFINNLDSDPQYRSWGNSVKMMVQPYFPGMIRPIARNFFTLVFMVNPAEKASQGLLKIAYGFWAHEIPVRIGLVWVVNPDKKVIGRDDPGVALVNFYNFVKTDRGATKALRFITDYYDSLKTGDVTCESVIAYFRKKFPDEDADLVFGSDSDYDTGRYAGTEFLAKSGLGSAPKVLLNGVPLDDTGLTADRFEETVINEVMRITPELQRDILQGKLDDSVTVMNYILDRPDVMPRLNARVLSDKSPRYIDMTDVMEYYPKSVYEFRKLTEDQKTAYMIKNVRYMKKADDLGQRPVTMWIAADLESKQGRALVYNGVKHLKTSNNVRLGVIHNPKNQETKPEDTVVSKFVQVALRVLPLHMMKSFVTKLVKEEFFEGLKSKQKSIDDLAVHGMDMESFRKEVGAFNNDFWKIHSMYAQQVLDLMPGEAAVVVNGRIVGPLPEEEEFTTDDFGLLEKFTLSSHCQAIHEQIKRWKIEDFEEKSSDVVMRTSALVMADPVRKRRHWVVLQDDHYSVVTIPASDETTAPFDVVAVVDPLSRGAQKLAPLLKVLLNVINADVKLVMNCKSKLSEMPLKSFYRFVLEPELQFSPTGARTAGAMAHFSALPQKQLLTLNVIAPESWMVQSIKSDYDLDNIKMEQVDVGVVADYQLEHLLLEGHCFDEISGNPPRGLQFTLGMPHDPVMVDTIVMANLGYFQLKANPGSWILQLREGRSSEIYDITSHDNTNSPSHLPKVTVLVSKFTGKTIRVRVVKKPDKLEEHLLIDSKDTEGKGIWDSISSALGGGSNTPPAEGRDRTINIFSLASGHLYERFLRIMMLSVLKQTTEPVKFWFLKNYLSPQFKEFLPYMAESYGFEYELVQYKWPRWLHQQTEKQRMIWGYKILFLDVLFPLDVKRIIFVDADQVVRTNMRELMDFDLDGAPYGYTPFCDSRKEMEGFRFWKQGYWANQLAGRRYHISALYVVDLKKFRQIAAGDRLRGQYQGLSHDPNSLSNLDQDLPNNMIHQVKIKSLPQEWLWCETWCDDGSKSKAKTIDLCNNPQTKEPKLDSAMRIIEEWKDYDQEISQLRSAFASRQPAPSPTIKREGPPESKEQAPPKKHEHDSSDL